MSKNILIVDDQKDIAMILEREFIRAPGDYVVHPAHDLAQALAILGQKPIDLVISDVRLGQDSGFALAGTIRGTYPSIGVILMSAYRSTANQQESEKLGVLQFVQKPFPVAKLVADVAEYFTRRESAPPVTVAPEPVPAVTPMEALPAAAHLQHFKAQDLVQLFCLNGKAIAISVGPLDKERNGTIYIQRGQVQHAEYGELAGDKAFSALMQIDDARLNVKDWDQPVPQSITTNWEHLLLNSALEADIERHANVVPLSKAG